jgi:hypothetical protein
MGNAPRYEDFLNANKLRWELMQRLSGQNQDEDRCQDEDKNIKRLRRLFWKKQRAANRYMSEMLKQMDQQQD